MNRPPPRPVPRPAPLGGRPPGQPPSGGVRPRPMPRPGGLPTPQPSGGLSQFSSFQRPIGAQNAKVNEIHAQVVARFQALQAKMYEEILGEQNFSYSRARNICQRVTSEPNDDFHTELKTMLFGSLALRIAHDRNEENYQVLVRRHLAEALLQLFESHPQGILRIKMAGASGPANWLLPANNFARELTGLLLDTESLSPFTQTFSRVMESLAEDRVALQFLLTAVRLAKTMAHRQWSQPPRDLGSLDELLS